MQLGGRAPYVLDSLPYPLHEGYTAVQRMAAGRLIYSATRVPSGQEVVVKFCLQYGAAVGVGGRVGVYGRWQRVFAVIYLKTGGSCAGKPRTCGHEGMLWAGLCPGGAGAQAVGGRRPGAPPDFVDAPARCAASSMVQLYTAGRRQTVGFGLRL